MKECLGRYNYQSQRCLDCEKRIECMLLRFKRPRPKAEWSDEENTPNCFGSYKGNTGCLDCEYQKDCKRTAQELKSKYLRRGRKERIVGKYKERGRWKERDYY